MRAPDPRPGDRVAVVGAGVSGLVAMYLLSRRYEVVLYEARPRLGGHAHTVDAAVDGAEVPVDTGFIVFNDRTYPNFCRLVDQLGVASHDAPMTFGVSSERTGTEYAVTSIDSLFAQRRNALRLSYYRFLVDMARWSRLARRSRGARYVSTRLRDWIEQQGFSERFVEEYLLPLGSAIWSCPTGQFGEFPVGFLAEFFHNHGMLGWTGHPQWKTITGGSRTYVRAIAAASDAEVRVSAPVRRVRRRTDRVEVETRAGDRDEYDHVVLACHADQALGMLDDADRTEADLLSRFAYQPNVATLHTDTRVLPARRKAWAAWNYRVPRDAGGEARLTYDMTRLQSLRSPRELLVTINDDGAVDAATRLGTWTYAHPMYSVDTPAAQRRHREVIARRRTSMCGAYWGFGFHEDGVASALRVCEAFGEAL